MKAALQNQIGGRHYAALLIQPVEFIVANRLDFFEGNVLKYVSRWRNKNGLQDLEKALHYCQLKLELSPKRRKRPIVISAADFCRMNQIHGEDEDAIRLLTSTVEGILSWRKFLSFMEDWLLREKAKSATVSFIETKGTDNGKTT